MPTKKLLTIQSSFEKNEKEKKARERFYKYCENRLSTNDELFKSILDDSKIFLEFKNELLKKKIKFSNIENMFISYQYTYYSSLAN